MVAFEIAAERQQAALPVPYQTWELPDGSIWTTFHREGGGYVLRFPELADFRVSGDGASVRCHPVPGVPEGTISHLHQNQVLPLALSKQGRLVFHASAVEVDDVAIAFVGASGRGKSTLAAAFAVAGHRFLTDDGLVVEEAGGRHLALPSHPSIRLWDDSEAALLEPGAATAPAVHYTSKSRFVAGGQLRFCAEPRPLGLVCFLGEGREQGIEIRPLTGTEAMMAWVRHSFLLDIEEKPRIASHFGQVGKLAAEPIHFALDYPRRYEDLARVRATLVEQARKASVIAVGGK